jgi:hypothetical protein
MKKLITICLVVLFAVNSYPVQASITGVALGTGYPPSTLGPYTMTAFVGDPRPMYELVTSVPSPLGGTVDFSVEEMEHRVAGYSWATWSNGYAGSVYYTGDYQVVTLTMPSGTGAFYLYAEPNPETETYKITANTQDYTMVSQYVSGNGGACGYGFWADGKDQISTIEVDYFGPAQPYPGFAVGEFGIATPEPATICLLGLGAILLRRNRR